ncbi:hypothetical protein ACT7CZ_28355 [Bacillus cereus]
MPANDDAIRAVKLLTSKMADAILEANKVKKLLLRNKVGKVIRGSAFYHLFKV